MHKSTKDLTGQKYGNLTVISYIGHLDRRDGVFWQCKCDCGNECIIHRKELSNGDCTSCGCVRSAATKKAHWTGYGNISGDYFSHIRRNAEKRKLIFNIHIEDIWKLFLDQNSKCALSGLTIELTDNASVKKATASLDRIDSNLGYIIKNVQWVHKDLNWMKNKYTQEYFINTCKMITKYQGEKNGK